MKKMATIAIALVMAIGMSAKGGAAKWDGDINAKSLCNYLKANNTQSDDVAYICQHFLKDWNRAANSKTDQQRKMQKALYKNLKLMRQTLTKEQYYKYTTLINLTLKNRNIELK